MSKQFQKAKQKFSQQPRRESLTVDLEAEITILNCCDEIDSEQLCRDIDRFRQQYPRSMGEVQDNTAVHAWHSDFRSHTLTDFLDPLIKLTLAKIEQQEDLKRQRGPNLTPIQFSVEEIWFNCYQTGDSVSRHNHGYIGYSTIYFAHAEDSATPVVFDNNSTSSYEPLTIQPYTGMLLIFPSFLYHRVPIVSENKRITVASNCFPKVAARLLNLDSLYR